MTYKQLGMTRSFFKAIVDCFRISGPMNRLVSASSKELKNGQESQTRRNNCDVA